ncbi:MAG: DUF4430 domain-containing protein [Ruminococcus sp.]|nr:DUF4430 domain-containing protein [Ruminococcus sp.]
MRTKAAVLLFCLLTIIFDLGALGINAAGEAHTVGEVEALAGGIVDYELEKSGADSIQSWIDGALTDGAGVSSEWFIVGLSQSGERNLSSYEEALKAYLSSGKTMNAVSKEKYALALIAAGSDDSFITEALSGSAGQQGIMSWIYALHIINNGYTAPNITADTVTEKLLSLQFADGGWALWGEYGDVDVTAMTLQALAPQYSTSGSVHAAVDRALTFLSEKQQPDGGYKGFGTDNPESASQVLTALSALGIDCRTDARFLKDGDIISAIASYRLADGSYCHVMGGESNPTATVQAYYAYVSYIRMKRGQSPLLVLDNRKPADVPVTVTTTAVQTTVAVTTAVTVTQTVTAVQTETEETSASMAASSTTDAKTTVTETTVMTSAVTETETVSSSVATSFEAAAGTSDSGGKGGYKGKVIAVICGAAGVLALAAFITGKRSYKNFIAIGVVAAAGIVFVLFTDFQSTDSYYTGEKKHKENAVGTVTMTIRCDTVADRCDHDYIPEDGIILDVTEFDIEEGETVYDILIEAARAYRIQVENRGSAGSSHGMVYIAGISYLYEMDFGDLSGWVYHVNGITPSRGCGEYVLSDGDFIEWLYTCELGHDLDEVYEE